MPNQLIPFYKTCRLIREAEEFIRHNYSDNKMKTPVHLINGAEAVEAGLSHAFSKGTKYFGTYRSHGLYLALTDRVESFFQELYGKEGGTADGKAGSMHLSCPEEGLQFTSAVVSSTIGMAVGSALASKLKKIDQLAVCVFGDGAIEEGVFWESLNFASVKRLKVLFICEDNDLAIHSPKNSRQNLSSTEDAVKAFNIKTFKEDGSDPESILKTLDEAKKYLESNEGPVWIRFKIFRFLEHVGINEDFDAGYRNHPTQDELKHLDPVLRAQDLLLESGVSKQEIEAIDASIKERIELDAQKAKVAITALRSDLLKHVYEEKDK